MNKKITHILKESGEKEEFRIEKILNSLKNSGVPKKLIPTISQKIENQIPLKSTREIYHLIYSFLQKYHPGAAGRYNLKKAIMELGPSGYPFEKFVGAIFKEKKFEVKLNVIVEGKCVFHEIDAIITKDKKDFIVECKYHNHAGLKTNVKVPLYIKARFDDLKTQWNNKTNHKDDFHQAWIVTNTKFTSNAIKYARCTNIKLIGWTYPKKESLAQMTDKLHLHPITTLSTLTKKQKKAFLQQGIILCRTVRENQALLKNFGLSSNNIKKIIAESEAICKLKNNHS